MQLPVGDTELVTLLRAELVATRELLLDDELLDSGADELDRPVVGELDLELELALETGALSFGFLPTKKRSGAGGFAIPSPIKKLGCGGWL